MLQHLTVERYDELVNVGVFYGQRFELVDGQLVEMSPQSPEHGSLIQWLTERFAARAELLRVQLPLAVLYGRPQPDLALARRRAHQHPDSALLVVEIVISSLDEDYAKLPGYAAAEHPARVDRRRQWSCRARLRAPRRRPLPHRQNAACRADALLARRRDRTYPRRRPVRSTRRLVVARAIQRRII